MLLMPASFAAIKLQIPMGEILVKGEGSTSQEHGTLMGRGGAGMRDRDGDKRDLS